MFNSLMPSPEELPSGGQLVRSTAIALVVACVLLVTVVMPAEFALDPTGIGRLLGLQQMGELKAELAAEDTATAETLPAGEADPVAVSPEAAPADSLEQPSHEMAITLKPNQAAEVKLTMEEGARVRYQWSVSGGTVNYDAHGDPPSAPKDFYHGYGKGRDSTGDTGELEAAFAGRHGWYWRNRGSSPVTVTLKTTGEYSAIKRVL